MIMFDEHNQMSSKKKRKLAKRLAKGKVKLKPEAEFVWVTPRSFAVADDLMRGAGFGKSEDVDEATARFLERHEAMHALIKAHADLNMAVDEVLKVMDPRRSMPLVDPVWGIVGPSHPDHPLHKMHEMNHEHRSCEAANEPSPDLKATLADLIADDPFRQVPMPEFAPGREFVVLVQTHDDGTVVKCYGPFDELEAAKIFASSVSDACNEADEVGAVVVAMENV